MNIHTRINLRAGLVERGERHGRLIGPAEAERDLDSFFSHPAGMDAARGTRIAIADWDAVADGWPALPDGSNPVADLARGTASSLRGALHRLGDSGIACGAKAIAR